MDRLMHGFEVPGMPAERPHAAEELMAAMDALYGNRFRAEWEGVDSATMRRHWQQALGALSESEMRRGLALLHTCELPPTLPQFMRLCRPSLDPYAAWLEAVAGLEARERGLVGDWSHPAIYRAATAIGAFDMKSLPYENVAGRWKCALEEALAAPFQSAVPVPRKDRFAVPGCDDSFINATKNCVDGIPAGKLSSLVKSVRGADPKRWVRRLEAQIKEEKDSEK